MIHTLVCMRQSYFVRFRRLTNWPLSSRMIISKDLPSVQLFSFCCVSQGSIDNVFSQVFSDIPLICRDRTHMHLLDVTYTCLALV